MVRKKKTLQVLDSLEMELAVVCSIGGRNIEGLNLSLSVDSDCYIKPYKYLQIHYFKPQSNH